MLPFEKRLLFYVIKPRQKIIKIGTQILFEKELVFHFTRTSSYETVNSSMLPRTTPTRIPLIHFIIFGVTVRNLQLACPSQTNEFDVEKMAASFSCRKLTKETGCSSIPLT